MKKIFTHFGVENELFLAEAYFEIKIRERRNGVSLLRMVKII